MEVTLRKLGMDLMEEIMKAIEKSRVISATLLLEMIRDEVPPRHLPTLKAWLGWCEENKVELRRSTLEISFREFLKEKATKLIA